MMMIMMMMMMMKNRQQANALGREVGVRTEEELLGKRGS